MGCDQIIAKYLKDLQSEYKLAKKSKQLTEELSYRPILHEFFKALAKYYSPKNTPSVILEPKNQNRAGRPDWLIQDPKSMAVFGYIEAKGIAPKTFDIENHHEQVERYRSLEQRLVITDGLDFLFCDPDKGEPEVVSLIDKKYLENGVWWQLHFNERFDHVMQMMFSKPKARIYDENALVEHVAVRTKYLAKELQKYASMKEDEAVKNKAEKDAVKFIMALRKVACNNTDSRLRTPAALSDFISQIVMFTLLYAYRVTCNREDFPNVKEDKIRGFISKLKGKNANLKPFSDLMNFVATHKESDIISTWSDECIRFLSFVKLTAEANKNPDYHKLFEKFLAEYNAQMRFDFGAYYTPEMLANYTVRLTEYIVKLELGADVYADQNTIIDPCCGTGSFIEEFIKNNPQGRKYTLCGFEIMPAPYMLANYRIAVVEKDLGGGPRKVNIVLTNTLHNCVSVGKANDDTIEGAELNRARSLSGKPLKLIIGNPPCSDTLRENNDGEEYSVINSLMEDFRPPATERHGRQNTQKQINNPFMQFLRWSCEKLLKSKTDSAISFVVPSSFLEAESYKYARRYLAKKFSSIWAVSVDADARTGIRSNSLFHTMQGRALIIATRRADAENGTAEFHYADLSRLDSDEKDAALKESISKCVKRFSVNALREDLCAFVPVKPFDEAFYKKFWPVSADDASCAIFRQHCSGVKLAPTALFTHVSKGALKRRSKDIAEKGIIGAVEWFQKQDKPPHDEKIVAFQNALKVKKTAQIDTILEKNIFPYVFRPFVYSNVLMWRELLDEYARIGGGGTRLRPELLKTFADDSAFGFAMAHAPKDLNPTLSQFVSFCWDLPDNDMCTRGNSHIYLNRYYSKEEGKVISNINEGLVSSVAALLECNADDAASQIIFYSYAVLCSQVYLDEFEGALFTTNQSEHRARIPFVADKKLFREIVTCGKELAKLEGANPQVENVLKINCSSIIKKLPDDFKMSASSSHFDEENEVLWLSDGVHEIRIPCPLAVQRLNISGYDVLKSAWLKFYSYNYTHTYFGVDELRKLLDLINALAVRQTIIGRVDILMAKVFAGKLIEPPSPNGGPGRGVGVSVSQQKKNAIELVQKVPASKKFVDYLPHYTIEAACGKFGTDKAVDMDGWVKVLTRRKLNKSMFVVTACGHSMEPKIRDGELCVFRKAKAVSRNGQIVLAMHDEYHDGETGGAYSIKQFMCTKGINPDSGRVENVAIVLKPANKAYDEIELKDAGEDSTDYRIVGEYMFSI